MADTPPLPPLHLTTTGRFAASEVNPSGPVAAPGDDGRWCQTHTGRIATAMTPRVEMFALRDVAVHLSRQNRYMGATPSPFSVAQHSALVEAFVDVHVDEFYTDMGVKLTPLARVNERIAGLFHDLGEAYLPDLPSPYKSAPEFAFYREAEDRILRCGEAWLALPAFACESPLVKLADTMVGRAEARRFFPVADRPREWRLTGHGWEPGDWHEVPNTARCLPPSAAADLFWRRAISLLDIRARLLLGAVT